MPQPHPPTRRLACPGNNQGTQPRRSDPSGRMCSQAQIQSGRNIEPSRAAASRHRRRARARELRCPLNLKGPMARVHRRAFLKDRTKPSCQSGLLLPAGSVWKPTHQSSRLPLPFSLRQTATEFCLHHRRRSETGHARISATERRRNRHRKKRSRAATRDIILVEASCRQIYPAAPKV